MAQDVTRGGIHMRSPGGSRSAELTPRRAVWALGGRAWSESADVAAPCGAYRTRGPPDRRPVDVAARARAQRRPWLPRRDRGDTTPRSPSTCATVPTASRRWRCGVAEEFGPARIPHAPAVRLLDRLPTHPPDPAANDDTPSHVDEGVEIGGLARGTAGGAGENRSLPPHDDADPARPTRPDPLSRPS